MTLGPHRRALRYDDWANHAVVAALSARADRPPASSRWLAHIVGAQWLWLARLQDGQPRTAVWPDLPAEDLPFHLRDLADAWGRYLDALVAADLSTRIAYVNSRGEPWESTVDDVLTHVVAHGTYHRGQIAADMRAAGMEPAYTDFIHATRTGSIETFG